MYAIVRSGGKQYRVEQGSVIEVERLPASEGERVELKVLMLNEDGRISLGDPTTADAKVIAEVLSHGRGPKVTVFKYKAKTRYRRKTGHRQDYTRLAIKEILPAGSEETTAKKPARKPRSRKSPAEDAAEPAAQ